MREAIASALTSRGAFRGEAVLDLFAGTGALSFEALSRGADRAVLVERNAKALKVLGQSACELGLRDRCRLVKRDLLRGTDSPPVIESTAKRLAGLCSSDDGFGVVFADPPYADIGALPAIFDALAEVRALRSDAIIVVEHATDAPPGPCKHFALDADYRYGGTGVQLLRLQKS